MDLTQLYRDLVLEHNRNPRHQGMPPHVTHRAVGDNPLCGDRLELGAQVEAGRVVALGYEIDASALTLATTSLLCQEVLGKSLPDAHTLLDHALDLFTRNPERQPFASLHGLNALLPVLDHPNRIKTVTLPIVTLKAALHGQTEVSTDLDQRGEVSK